MSTDGDAQIETFKEILIGHLPKTALLRSLEEKGIQFNKYAHILFEDPSFAPPGAPEKIKLVKVNLQDLGLTKPAIYQDIISRAEASGLKLCPLIVGAHLRLEYEHQPEGPYLKIASPRVGSSDDTPRGLYLRKTNQTLWLRGFCASDDWEYPIETEFIFQK